MKIAEGSDRWIVEKAIAVVLEHGSPYVADNMPGFSQLANFSDLQIMYTTPFSGFEVLPGKRLYMIDIWTRSKKVLAVYMKNLKSLNAAAHGMLLG